MCKLLFIVFLLFFSAIHGQSGKPANLIAYYSGHYASIEKYDISKLSHIVFSFCHLRGNRLFVDNKSDTLTIKKLVDYKRKYPTLKIILALGGWGGCKTCSDVFSSDKGRTEFAISCKELLDFFAADGIDLDWEYPAIPGYPGHRWRPADKINFTSLLKKLRETLPQKAEISFAAGVYQQALDSSIEWKRAAAYADRVHLMTYDLVSSRNKNTGHHTALYSGTMQKESVDYAVNFVMARGVPASKIVIGAAFYGRVFKNVGTANNGLYQPGKFLSFITYKKLATQLEKRGGYKVYYDSIAKASYGYNSEKRTFVTYDDFTSVALKATYTISKNLNGIMFWELSQDFSTGGFLKVISETLAVENDR
jgi:chitinase